MSKRIGERGKYRNRGKEVGREREGMGERKVGTEKVWERGKVYGIEGSI